MFTLDKQRLNSIQDGCHSHQELSTTQKWIKPSFTDTKLKLGVVA